MILKVKIEEQSECWEFRELVGCRVSALLADKDALTEKPLHYVKASYAWDNWSIIRDNNGSIKYFLMNDPLFTALIHDDLLEKASEKFPESFGTNEPEKVLEALNKTLNIPYYSSTEEFNRQTSYSIITNQKKEKILFLGLFRGIDNDEEKKGEYLEFKAGYLHSLSHFCGRDNQPISSNKEAQKLPDNFIEEIIKCFFENEPAKVEDYKKIKGDKILKYKYLLGGKKYDFKFYYSRKFEIYFLLTIHRQKK